MGDVAAVDSADVVLDVEVAEDMIAEIAMAAIAMADSVVEEEEVEEVSVVVEAAVAVEAEAATTATKKVILPENAQRETVVAMEDPNTKIMGLFTRNPINFSCLDVI